MTDVQHTASHADDPVHRIFHYALLTQASVDVCVHAYVIVLILTVAKDTLKTFRYYLLFCAVCEVCFVTWIGFVWQPRSFMPRWECTSAQGFLKFFGFNGAVIGQVGIAFFGGTIVGSQLYALLYRLVVVTATGAFEKFISYAVTTGFTLAILLLSCGFAYAHYMTLGSQAYVLAQLPAMQATGHISANDLAIACNDLSRPTDITIAATALATFACLSEATCVALAAATFWRLRRATLLSETTRKMHAALTRLLLIQSVVPFVVALAPSLAYYLAILFGIPMDHFFVYGSMFSLFTFPLINAFITLRFVRPYRDYTIHLCGRVLRKKNAVVVPILAMPVPAC